MGTAVETNVGIVRSVSSQSCLEPYLLCDTLPLYPNSKPLYRITVTSNYITWEVPSTDKSVGKRKNSLKGKRSSSRQSLGTDSDSSGARDTVVSKGGLFLHFEDIVGCDTMKGKVETDKGAYVTIYAYPHKKKVASKRTIRKRETLTLTFNQVDNYEQNLEEANRWLKVLKCLVRRMHITHDDDLSQLEVPVQKKTLMFVNPMSGSGNGVLHFKQRIVSVLAESSMPYEVKVTEYQGQAREIMKVLNLAEWYGVVIVSGDGLVHEVINGMMERADRREVSKFPVGVLPCGSGNALACTISSAAGEPYLDKHILHATFALTRHVVRPMDLVAIDTSLGIRRYSFLSCCWGLFADVDIESEKYRGIGEARFTLGAVVRIMGLRKYQGKVSFLPVEEYTPSSQNHRNAVTRSQSVQPPAPRSSASLARTQSMAVEAQTATQYPEVSRLQGQDSVAEPDILAEGLKKVEVAGKNAGEDPSGRETSNVPVASPDGPPEPDTESPCPPLDQPVPPTWSTIEGEFVAVNAIYLSHLGKDLISAPTSRLEDGVIYLNIIRAGIGRMKMISLMGELQKGNDIKDPHVETIKVKAFRMEPVKRTDEDIMTMDGEKIEYGPLQGYVIPSAASVMVPNKGYFAEK